MVALCVTLVLLSNKNWFAKMERSRGTSFYGQKAERDHPDSNVVMVP